MRETATGSFWDTSGTLDGKFKGSSIPASVFGAACNDTQLTLDSQFRDTKKERV